MKRLVFSVLSFILFYHSEAQVMTSEILWSLGRVNGLELSADGKKVYYSVTRFDQAENKGTSYLFAHNLTSNSTEPYGGGQAFGGELSNSYSGKTILSTAGMWTDISGNKFAITDKEYSNVSLSPDGSKMMFTRDVKCQKTKADYYPNLVKSEAKIYDDLMFRHWNVWEDGNFQHVFLADVEQNIIRNEKDLMPGEQWDAPTFPNGGKDELAWSPDSKTLAYVSVKKTGKDYAVSTNSDIYFYNLSTGVTTNFTAGMDGYDRNPAFSPDGSKFAWVSMKRDGCESDKTDIIVQDLNSKKRYNLTANWDDFVSEFIWSRDGKSIYFTAPYRGVIALFELPLSQISDPFDAKLIRKLSNEEVDYNHIIGQAFDGKIICQRTDMNHAVEIYSLDPKTSHAEKLTRVNDYIYDRIKLSKIEKQWITTSDKKKMLAWVIFPPDFDPARKYPTLLYCQGGPQSALSQFYSFRWNFQLMAAHGYIVVAPNRRDMPGWGTAWNEQISGDWGGQVMKDYLAAIDQVSEKPYVDKSRRGAVGASYGGYSVMMLAGIHKNRFKTMITHCGSFNLDSWYGSTEEMWFANFDLKGPYWQKKQPASYKKFSPHRFVQNWNTPILIIQGGKDYRIPDTQAFEAFTAARLQNVKSRLVYFPDEGHHILKMQNGLLWQGEFHRWLEETL